MVPQKLSCCIFILQKRGIELLVQQQLQIAADSKCSACSLEETENSQCNYFQKFRTSQYGQTPVEIYTGQIIALLRYHD